MQLQSVSQWALFNDCYCRSGLGSRHKKVSVRAVHKTGCSKCNILSRLIWRTLWGVHSSSSFFHEGKLVERKLRLHCQLTGCHCLSLCLLFEARGNPLPRSKFGRLSWCFLRMASGSGRNTGNILRSLVLCHSFLWSSAYVSSIFTNLVSRL